MLELIQKFFGKEPSGSKDIAKERLRLVLVHDRVNVSPQFMEIIKDDMIKVISNYMEINESQMEINLTKTNSSVALIANIPVNRMKRGVMPTE
ncbi:MAG TPA: cell division topological specificity factor MinE [Methylomusa anaerophila]|uniref:cell division topological specificity factor MinE n=1 Tax=Methylomusa anaerophila TaxID=1930071 RepID=UPI000F81FE68|nr:cell division topological specificity factor MinE [Methylomusa anaerophila]HML89205.1 cell division topological specificity factor MinE [Methylomusa anaerophila]